MKLFELKTAAVNTQTITHDGVSYYCVSGDTFAIKDQIKALGFRWNPQQKLWYIQQSSVDQNPAIQQQIAALSGPGPAARPPQPQQPQQQPVAGKPPGSNWYNQNQGTIRPKWFLAMSNTTKEPMAIGKLGDKWAWQSEGGQSGFGEENALKQQYQTVNDDAGQPIWSENPAELFQIFKSKYSVSLDTQEQQAAAPGQQEIDANGNAVGRIPDDKISPYGRAIQDSFLQTNKSLTINALAGTGKTTTLRHLASFKDPNEKWLYLVFNKKNQVEASTGKGRFPNGVEVLTSHAFLGRVLGSSADRGALPRTNLWNEAGERMGVMLDETMANDQTFPQNLRFAAMKSIKQLASLGKACAVRPDDPQAPARLIDIAGRYDVDMDLSTDKVTSDRDWTQPIVQKALGLLQQSLPGAAGDRRMNKVRDHDDTLWYAAINPNIAWPAYDVVLADEIQDFNKCQTIMLQKLAAQGARIVAVGDPHQSIYAFRGADAHAFEAVNQVVGASPNGAANHELPVNYRCGKKIIDYVNQKTDVKNLKAGRDFEGEVTEGMKRGDAMTGLYNEVAKTGKLAQQTAFIARTNAPLVEGALNLMKQDIDFVLVGRDFSKELVDVIERITGKGRTLRTIPIENLAQEIEGFISGIESRWRGKIAKAAQLVDLRNISNSVISVVDHLASMNYTDQRMGMTVKNSTDFMNYVKRRFAGVNLDNAEEAKKVKDRDPLSFVTLTSAHRSKGLEFDRVYIMQPGLFPHPKAKTPDAIQQERNCWYVSLTRARNALHVLANEDPDKKESEAGPATPVTPIA